MSAFLVATPNLVVSLPLDPSPVRAMVKPFWFRKIWSCLTSVPTDFSLRVRVKSFDGIDGVEVIFEGFG